MEKNSEKKFSISERETKGKRIEEVGRNSYLSLYLYYFQIYFRSYYRYRTRRVRSYVSVLEVMIVKHCYRHFFLLFTLLRWTTSFTMSDNVIASIENQSDQKLFEHMLEH